MSGLDRAATERAKLVQDKCQSILTSMLSDTDNKYCVDCDAKGPRWVSWNLGVFLCIRCAGIHRNLGVHISKVKSVNLDSWKPEQVVMLQQIGNSRARAAYEANLPDNFRRPQADMALESFIRAKYEHNKYTAREWVPPQVPKVSWDAEIDALRRRDGLRRPGGRGTVETPVLPAISKPRPPTAAVAPPAAAPTLQSANNGQSHTADLLGISTGDSSGTDNNVSGSSAADLFGDFLAASVPPTSNTATSVGVGSAGQTAEEVSFFSQTVAASPAHVAPPAVAQNSAAAGGAAGGQSGGAAVGQSGGVAGGPMSRDSIMALYGTPQQQQSTGMGLTSPIGGGVFGMSTSGGVAGGFAPAMYTPSPVSQVPLQYQQTGTPGYQQQGYAAVPHQYQSGTQHNYPYQMHQQMSSMSLGASNAPPASSNMAATINLMSSTMNRSH